MAEKKNTNWTIAFSSKADKQLKRLPDKALTNLTLLIKDLEDFGPIQKKWGHFSALGKQKNIPDNAYHCHIKSGRPTYVACWKVENKKIKIIEIFYVGSHEDAPY